MSKIYLESGILNDKYTEYLYRNYDIQNRDKVITEVPIPSSDDFNSFLEDGEANILLICGNSGSGKSSILRALSRNVLHQHSSYDRDKCVISQFSTLDEKSACELLCGVGLSSVPTWLKKVDQLSNGERARFDVCKAIFDAENYNMDFVIIDEFTSVVNREAAKSMSFSLQRYARQKHLKLVIASCHYDIIDWIQPNYIFNLNHKDEDGNVEMEKLVYSDSNSYISSQTIDEKDALTEKIKL